MFSSSFINNNDAIDTRLALSAFRDQCPPLTNKQTYPIEDPSCSSSSQALMASSRIQFETTCGGDIASASSMQMISRNALSANRGKRTIHEISPPCSTSAYSLLHSAAFAATSSSAAAAASATKTVERTVQQVKWLKTGEMKIVRKRQKVEVTKDDENSTFIFFSPNLDPNSNMKNAAMRKDGKKESAAAAAGEAATVCFQSMIDWKRYASKSIWRNCMDQFHGGYFRQCSALLAICFLRYGPFIVQRWIVHNVDSHSSRVKVQLSTMQRLKTWTIQSVYYGSFPIMYYFLQSLPLDIIINTAIAWLRADLEQVCREGGGGGCCQTELQDWMELFVLRIMPWFIRLFFFYPATAEAAAASSRPCPITKHRFEELLPHLEFTWVKKASIDPMNLWSTMSVQHSKSVFKQTVSIPLLGVRQHERLHREEEEMMMMPFPSKAKATEVAVVSASAVQRPPFFHSNLIVSTLQDSASMVQTRSITRSTFLYQEDKKKMREIWMHNIAATKRLVLCIPKLHSTLLLFTQLAKRGAAAAAGDHAVAVASNGIGTGFQQILSWLDPLHWSLPSNGKVHLESFQETKCFTRSITKQLLCHAESEIQWSSFLEEIHVDAETTPWIIYTLSSNHSFTTSTRIRALYCFCNQHALPLLKRITFFSPISGYRIGVITDAYGIDVSFLDDCGSSGNGSSAKRDCILRFFNTCHLSSDMVNQQQALTQVSKSAVEHHFAQTHWELEVTPVYHSCCVFKEHCQASIFNMKPIGMQLPQRHLLFESFPQSHFEFKTEQGKWCRSKKK